MGLLGRFSLPPESIYRAMFCDLILRLLCRRLRFRSNKSQISVPSVFRLEKYYNVYCWVPELT